MVLKHASYASSHEGRVVSGLLCPPFVGVAVPTPGEIYPTELGAIRGLFARIDQAQRDDLLRRYIYTLGLTDYNLEHKGQILEYKQSNREPDKYKCYNIERYSLVTTHERDIANLADPLCHGQFVYLPLHTSSSMKYLAPAKANNMGVKLSFRGMPLSSNFTTLMSDQDNFDHLQSAAIEVPQQILAQDYTGFICKIDLAHFGSLSQSLFENVTIPFAEGPDVAAKFSYSLQDFCQDMALQQHLIHYVFLGDGFLAAVPDGTIDTEVAIAGLGNLCSEIDAYIKKLNLQSKSPWVGYRCSIIHGPYRYGRSSFCSSHAQLSGYCLKTAARLEEGLRGISATPEDARVPQIAVDQTTFEQYEFYFQQHFNVIRAGHVTVKEAALNATLCKPRS